MLAVGLALVTIVSLVVLLSRWGGDRSVTKTAQALAPGSRHVPVASAAVALNERSQMRPGVVRVVSGQRLRLLIENESPLQHDFIIDELDAHADLGLGEGATILLSGLRPGTYTSWCSLEGHRDRLTVIVR